MNTCSGSSTDIGKPMFGNRIEKAVRDVRVWHEGHTTYHEKCPHCKVDRYDALIEDSMEATAESRDEIKEWVSLCNTILKFKAVTTVVKDKKFILVPYNFIKKIEEKVKNG